MHRHFSSELTDRSHVFAIHNAKTGEVRPTTTYERSELVSWAELLLLKKGVTYDFKYKKNRVKRGSFCIEHSLAFQTLIHMVEYDYMKESFTPRWLSEEEDTNPLEKLIPGGEPDSSSAEALIERLKALDELTRDHKLEAEKMIEELEVQIRFFKDQKLQVPETLPAAITELRKLTLGLTKSVREEYADTEAEPLQLAELLAESGQLELEIIEQEASGVIGENIEDLRTRVEALLPHLDAISVVDDEDMKAALLGQQTILRRFLRDHCQ